MGFGQAEFEEGCGKFEGLARGDLRGTVSAQLNVRDQDINGCYHSHHDCLSSVFSPFWLVWPFAPCSFALA